MSSSSVHVPVLLYETLSHLDLHPGTNVVDGTIGGGGHAEAILEATAPDGRLLGVDLDPDALERARGRLAPFGDRFEIVQGNFANLDHIVRDHPAVDPVRGVLLDLGLSSDLLADARRGFSWQEDGPLDMRFDRSGGELTASMILNTWSVSDLTRILREYGQEPFAAELVAEITTARKKRSWISTRQLLEAVLLVFRERLRSKREVPWIGGRHPATKTFQALRIAVNDELGTLKRGIEIAFNILAAPGRLAVISFHSLEDRIVKTFFRELAKAEKGLIITKKPVAPQAAEQRANPRSRSAKLRVIEKRRRS